MNRAVKMLLLVVLLAACHGARPAYQVLDQDADPLRTAFNAAAGQVRVIVLASPT